MSKAISYSRYGTHKKCPAMYAHNYVWDTPHERQSSGPAAERGTLIHQSIEDFLDSKRPDVHPDAMKHFEYISGMRDRGASPEIKYCFDKDWTMLDDFDHEDGYVRGIVDLILVEDEWARVDDWKSGRIYDDHVEQRSLYGLFILKAYPQVQEVEVGNVYTDKKGEPHHLTTMAREKMWMYQDTWDKNIAKMHLPMYPERPGPHCKWCPFSKKKGGPCELG